MDPRPAVQPHRGLNRGQPSPGTGVVVWWQGYVSEEASSVGATVGPGQRVQRVVNMA